VYADEDEFTGKERDTESGLDYFGARYMASTMGRFMSPDPLAGHLANPQSLNRYVYVLDNPLKNTDPTGMYVCDDDEDCKSDNDKKFAEGLADARNAAWHLTGADLLNAMNAINSYGDKGVDNGVDVKFADTGQAAGQTRISGITGQKTEENPTGQNIEVTLSPNAAGAPGVIAHEGSHVADGAQWIKSGFSPGMDPTRYQTEIHAYHVQFDINQQMTAYPFMPRSWLGGDLIPGEPWKDFMPTVQEMLKSNPAYGFDYKDTTAAFVKGAAIPQ
jgi:RHS repeat-associated protein